MYPEEYLTVPKSSTYFQATPGRGASRGHCAPTTALLSPRAEACKQLATCSPAPGASMAISIYSRPAAPSIQLRPGEVWKVW